MRTTALAVAVLCLAGCARDDAACRLGIGEEMTTYRDPKRDLGTFENPAGVHVSMAPTGDPSEHFVSNIAVGTKVRTADDSAEDLEPSGTMRPIKVQILEGPHAGRVGTIDRRDLRPVSR